MKAFGSPKTHTNIHKSASFGLKKRVDELLTEGIDVNEKDDYGMTREYRFCSAVRSYCWMAIPYSTSLGLPKRPCRNGGVPCGERS